MAAFRDKNAEYAPLHRESDHFEDVDEALGPSHIEVPLSKPRKRSFVLISLAWVFSSILFAFLGGIAGRKLLDMDKRCAAYTTQYCQYRNLPTVLIDANLAV